jgi:hypothetical protein
VADDFTWAVRAKSLRNHRRAVASQNRTDTFVQVRKSDFVIFFTSHYQQWRLKPLQQPFLKVLKFGRFDRDKKFFSCISKQLKLWPRDASSVMRFKPDNQSAK